ncbi:hypothetical protein C3369_06720 [Escherichia sp. ESNIH1]|uniref:hypothetical protein n=1 Tax=Escherichia sp. ESNIH1 TaxID=1985876 RepID=UPI000CDDA357|nr:hypothetical protein [Escherichia sp. ESNIH1]POU03512.1 hypothetical protein C3369_06720 [Escherichia sp. ESNIH1]
MNSTEWQWALNDDQSLYFYPVGHRIEGNFRIHFELSGSYNLRVSDVHLHGEPTLLFEYFDEDDDSSAVIDFLKVSTTVEDMILHLNSTDSIYHDPIYKTIYEWAVRLFYK